MKPPISSYVPCSGHEPGGDTASPVTGRTRVRPGLVHLAAGALLCASITLSPPASAAVLSPEAIRTLITENRIEEAIAASRERIAAQPKEPDAHVLLANALFAKARSNAGTLPDGRPAPFAKADVEAIASVLEAGIGVAPTRKDIYLGLIDVWSAAGRDEDLLRQVQRSASQFPTDAKMMNGLLDYGFEHQTRGDPLAGRILETVHAGYPRASGSILAWASYLLNRGELERSIHVLETGIAAAPASADLQEALGDALCYKLDFAAATKAYARSSAIDPQRRPVKLNWAAALHVNDPKSARIVAEPLRVEERASKVPTVEISKDGVKQAGRIPKAASQLMRALGDPSFGSLEAYTLAKNFWNLALAPAALAETQVAIVKDPLSVEVWMLRADIFARAGLDKQALEALERADAVYDVTGSRSFAFTRDEVIAARAATLGRLGRDEDAVKTYKRASNPSQFAYSLAILLERQGRIEDARGYLEQVVAVGTNAAEVEAAKTRLSQDVYRKP